MAYYKSRAHEQATLLPMALGTSEQRDAARRAQAEADARIDKQVADRAAKDTGPISPYAGYIADLEAKRQFAYGDEKSSIERRLRLARPQQAEWEQQQAAAERKTLYDLSPAAVLMREHAAAFARTPPPGADPQQVALAVAFAKSERFQNPLDASREYFQTVRDIEAAALEREKLRLVDVAAGAGQALVSMNEAEQAVKDNEQRLAEAQRHLEGSNGP